MVIDEILEMRATDSTRDSVEKTAEACHEANRAFCQSIGDDSQPSWDDAPQWQKESAVAGVKAVIEDPETKPEDSHNSWKKMKRDDGWKWGPEKNPEKKEHPCIVDSYMDLPEDQRKKDDIFLSTAKEKLRLFGLI